LFPDVPRCDEEKPSEGSSSQLPQICLTSSCLYAKLYAGYYV
jgi:hypothetical protein